ncbi:MAG: ROK family glucokinase [Lachnospiraceae bacterium]|nr:ROK family glucokinase [Lachnospiraceae bacterium]
MKKYGFGVDIGGTTIKLGLFETSGKLIEKWEIPTRTEEKGAKILPDVAAAVRKKYKERGLHKEDIEGIGIGVPGPVDADGVVHGCVNLGWKTVDVVSAISALTGLQTAAANDANIAALGEMWQGGGRGCENVLMVTLGTGVGGGVIMDGRIAAGAHGAGGEIGHMTVDWLETEPCNCGRKGCLEQYASATGVVRLAKKHVTKFAEAENLTAKDIFDAAKSGDENACDVVFLMSRILGGALANVAVVCDPEIIVIGGGVSKAGDFLLDAVQKQFEDRAFPACKGTRFALAELGNDAGIYGGMKLVLE